MGERERERERESELNIKSGKVFRKTALTKFMRFLKIQRKNIKTKFCWKINIFVRSSIRPAAVAAYGFSYRKKAQKIQ